MAAPLEVDTERLQPALSSEPDGGHQVTTLIHERVAAARSAENPTVIGRVPSGWIVLGDNQIVRGYSLLLADPVVSDLNSLSVRERARFLQDMAALGDALLAATDAYLINYQVLGNKDHALHAHVHPRYQTEPEGRRHKHPFRYQDDPSIPFDSERDAELMAMIRDALRRQGSLLSAD